MPIPEEIPAKEARVRFGEVIDRARYGHTSFLVKKAGKPMAIILGIEDYKSLIDAIESMTEQLGSGMQPTLRKPQELKELGNVGTTEEIKRILKQ